MPVFVYFNHLERYRNNAFIKTMLLSKSLISRIWSILVSKKIWKKYRLTSEGNARKNAQNYKAIINTIYIKPDFPRIKKIVRKL